MRFFPHRFGDRDLLTMCDIQIAEALVDRQGQAEPAHQFRRLAGHRLVVEKTQPRAGLGAQKDIGGDGEVEVQFGVLVDDRDPGCATIGRAERLESLAADDDFAEVGGLGAR